MIFKRKLRSLINQKKLNCFGWDAPDPCKSATQGRCLRDEVASYFDGPLPQKINLISCELIVHISDIKLIRTDTTLDLSQKAEKGMPGQLEVFGFYNQSFSCFSVF